MAVHTAPPRTHSARRTLVSLLLIPLVSLAALWVFTASITLGNVLRNQHYNTVTNTIAPSVIGLQQTVETERALTIAWLSTGRQSAPLRKQLDAGRRATDATVAAVRVSTASVRGLISATGQAQLGDFLTRLAGLPGIRAAADAGTDSVVTAFAAYTAIDSAELGFFRNATPPSDSGLSLMTQASLAVNSAEDFTGGAIALLAGALAAQGHLPQAERTLFAQVVAEQNLEISDAFSLATPELATLFRQVFDSPAYRQLLATESQVTAAGPADRTVAVNPVAFQANALAVEATIQSVQPRLGAVLAVKAASLSNSLKTELYLTAGFGLLAVIASQFVAIRFGTRLRRELSGLYDNARQMAEERLPRLVDRLRRGDDVDVQAESPPLKTGRITEIANVARAFTAVQHTAVEAAVGQAAMRKGVSQVFVSLSLRNQSLLHRQLGMLDEMERATSDPVALADLFRLDHLTTRMRRHAEGLLILAGATPGRGWRDPVPVADVLNAAVAEVEDYVRVDVVTDAADTVAGTAVNDVIHLLAELVENATVYSPPKTRVEVRGDSVGHGFAVEIEDRGLGMPAEEIAAVNARLVNPPEFDLANSDQLGLFVAARLAQRHDIKVSLRRSPFGGTTAIVLLPPSIIVPADGAGWMPGAASLSGPSPTLAGGPARGPRPAGGSDDAAAFGITGRHRRGGSAPQPGSLPGPRSAPPALEPPVLEPPVREPAFRETPARPAQERPAPHPAHEAPRPGAWFSRALAPGGIAAGGTELMAAELAGTQFGKAAVAGSRPGLPRRARGTNLAPQLRAKLSTAPAPGGWDGPGSSVQPAAPTAEPPDRSPEEAGGLLSALQDGWERARMEDLDYFDGEDQ